jgi:DNA replication protein DnaC
MTDPLLSGLDLWEGSTAVLRTQRAVAGWRASLPARFNGWDLASFAGLDPPPVPVVVACLTDWALSPIRNLIVIGSTGSGKTAAAVAAVDSAVSSLGLPARFFVYTELLDAFRSGDLRVADVAGFPLLVIDDLGGGRSTATEYEIEKIETLINRRWLDGLPTVVTSSLTLERLQGRIGERAYDRLREDALAMQIATPTSRRR